MHCFPLKLFELLFTKTSGKKLVIAKLETNEIAGIVIQRRKKKKNKLQRQLVTHRLISRTENFGQYAHWGSTRGKGKEKKHAVNSVWRS